MKLLELKLYMFVLLVVTSCSNEVVDVKSEIQLKSSEVVESDYSKNGIAAKLLFNELLKKSDFVDCLKGDFYRMDCGYLLGSRDQFAFLSYFTSDSTAQVIVCKKSKGLWLELYNEELEMLKELNDFSYVRFEDFTGDGVYEVLLPASLSAANGNSQYHCLQLVGHTFERIQKFDCLTRPQFDKKTNTVHSLHKGGFGNYIASEYQLKNSKLIETKRIISGVLVSKKTDYVQVVESFSVNDKVLSLIDVDSIVGRKVFFPSFWATFLELYED